MNNTKQILCNIVKHLKGTQDLTFSSMRLLLSERGCKVTDRQINQIINHVGKGVSVSTLDKIIHHLGYETEVRITTNGNY